MLETKVSPKLYLVWSRDHATLWPQKIFGDFLLSVANDIEIIGYCGLGNDMPLKWLAWHIGC